MEGNRPPVQMSYLVPAPTDGLERLLRETPVAEQPLARLEKLGPSALSTNELLLLLLDAKADPLLPLQLINTWGTLDGMANASPLELLRVNGMTRVRSGRLRAALELGKRARGEQYPDHPIVRSPADAAELLIPEMSGLQQEQMRVIRLNTKNRVVGISTVYQGSIHTTVIRVSELFREAVQQNAAAVIIAHNHPSSDPTPSPEDVAVTREIVQAGKILDVDVMDHLIIGGPQKFVSLKERGLGFS